VLNVLLYILGLNISEFDEELETLDRNGEDRCPCRRWQILAIIDVLDLDEGLGPDEPPAYGNIK
jgi:hypothetical protein